MGTPIFIVNATDPDQGAGGSVLYSFQPPSSFFAIDSGRGIVSVIRELDYEVTQAYQLQVNATVSRLLPVFFQRDGATADLFHCPVVLWASSFPGNYQCWVDSVLVWE